MSKWHAIVVTVLAGMLAALAARGQAQTPAYEIVVSTGHRADVTRVALALGGTLLASSAGSQSKLWDVATGHLLRNNEGGLLAISADGRRMLAGSTTGKTLRLSDPVTGEGRQAFPAEAPGYVQALAFPPQGARVIAHSNKLLELWDADAGKCLHSFEGHTDYVRSAALSADGTRLASASLDRTLRIWDTATGGSLSVINFDAWAIAISPKGDRMAATPLMSGTAKLWDSDGKLLRELPGEYSVNALAFSPDGTRLAIGTGEGNVVVWDADSGARLHTLATPIGYGVRALSFSSDGTRIVSGHAKGLIAVWNALTGERVGSFAGSISDPGEVQFSPDGALVTTSTGKAWDAASGALRHDFKKPSDGKVVFSPDGKHAMAGGSEKVVLWDVASGKELRRFDYPATAHTLAFSRDGALAIVAGSAKEIDLWDIARGRLVQRFSGVGSHSSIALSPDGTRLAAGDDNSNLTIWNIKTGAIIRRQKEPENIDQLQFSPDGSRIIGRSYRLECHWYDKVGALCMSVFPRTPIYSMKLWNSDSGALLGTFSGVPSALAPDGRLLATLVPEKRDGKFTWPVALWQTADAARAGTLSGPDSSVTALAFSPDGRRLIAGHYDGTLTLFEVATGKLVHNNAGHRGAVPSAAFSPDGARLVSTGDDKVTKVWKADTGELLATLIEDGEWIALTPEGFYAASPAGGRLLSVVKGLRVLDPQQAHAILHRPELVREKLAGDPRGTVRTAAADLRFP